MNDLEGSTTLIGYQQTVLEKLPGSLQICPFTLIININRPIKEINKNLASFENVIFVFK